MLKRAHRTGEDGVSRGRRVELSMCMQNGLCAVEEAS